MESPRIGPALKLNLLVCVLIFLKAEGFFVPITYVENAVAKGAGEILFLYLILVNFNFTISSNVYNSWEVEVSHILQFVWMGARQLTTLIRDLDQGLITG